LDLKLTYEPTNFLLRYVVGLFSQKIGPS